MNAIERFPDFLREALGEDLKIARDVFADAESGAPPSLLWWVTDVSQDRITFELECRSETDEGAQTMGGHIHSYLENIFGENPCRDYLDGSYNLPLRVSEQIGMYVPHYMAWSLPADIPSWPHAQVS